MKADLDLLAVMAHPDDAELLCGGALAKCASAGGRVGILDLSAGEAASSGTPELRAAEASRAAAVLGVSVRRCAGLPDAGIIASESQRRVVARQLRELRPRVVVTHWSLGRHPDHAQTAELVRQAAFLAGLPNYRTEQHPHTPGEGERRRSRADAAPELPAFRPHKLVYATAFREDAEPPDFVVDISAEIELRMKAMEAYRSQFAGATGVGEVFRGGDRPIEEQVLAKLAHYGSLIRVAYGEPYRTGETIEVGDLADLGVSSF